MVPHPGSDREQQIQDVYARHKVARLPKPLGLISPPTNTKGLTKRRTHGEASSESISIGQDIETPPPQRINYEDLDGRL